MTLLARFSTIFFVAQAAGCASLEAHRVEKRVSEHRVERGINLRVAPALWHLDDSDATLHGLFSVGRVSADDFDYTRWDVGGQFRKPVVVFAGERRQFWLGVEVAVAVRGDASERPPCGLCNFYPGVSGLSLSALAGVSRLPERGLKLGFFAGFGTAFYPRRLADCGNCRREWSFRVGFDAQPWFLHPGASP